MTVHVTNREAKGLMGRAIGIDITKCISMDNAYITNAVRGRLGKLFVINLIICVHFDNYRPMEL